MLKIVAVLTFVIFETSAQNLVSPCPAIFKYDDATGEKGVWFGTVTLKSDTRLSGVNLRVTFDRSVIGLENWFGKVLFVPDTEYVIKNAQHELLPDSPLKIKIVVRFDASQPTPQLTRIKLNARTICDRGNNELAAPSTLAIENNNDYELISPCPASFRYEKQTQNDRWDGVIKLESVGRVHGVRVKIILDKPARQLGNYFAPVETTDNTEFTLNNSTFFLQRNAPMNVKFYVLYNPRHVPPKVTEMRLNDITFCCTNHTQPSTGNSLFISQVVTNL